MIKALLLDFYGVIQTDEVDVWAESYIAKQPELQAVFDDISRRIDLDEITLDQYYEELAAVGKLSVEELKGQLAEKVIINYPLLDLVDEVRHQGQPVAVLSNDGSSLRDYIEEHNITKHFDQIFISGEIGYMKPDERIYQHAIEELGFEPSEVIFFDDRQANVEGARRAGLQAELYSSVSQVRNLLS